MIRLTLVLAAVTFAASLALGFVYQGTKSKIELQDKLTKERARRIALPEAACGVFVEEKGEAIDYYEGYRKPDTTGFAGYVVIAEGKGYSSTIESVVGVDSYGRITGLRITGQQETPGLGAKSTETRPGEEKPWFQQQFAGKFAGEIMVEKDGGEIVSITGATITSRAVANSIQSGIELLSDYVKIEKEETDTE